MYNYIKEIVADSEKQQKPISELIIEPVEKKIHV